MTKKFWCHYVGNDGNTPKRRSIELTNLADKLPAIGDNVNCATPIWYDYDEHYKIYEIYVQLSETVAVSTLIAGVINGGMMDFMLKTDADFEAERDEHIKSIMANTWDSSFTPEKKAASCEARKRRCEDSKRSRDRYIAKVMQYKDYTDMLLNGSWIANATVRAYEEAQSPYLPAIQELRRQNMVKRDAEIKADAERRRKAAEEEARKKAEAQSKDDAKIQKLVELGLLPDNLTKMQRGQVLAALEERGRYEVAGKQKVCCTVYELITEHGFNRMSHYQERYKRDGELLAKPRNYYDVMNDTLGYGYQINGRMGALMIERNKQ